ncbi:aminotransferase class III-fold pyridoxal phosphate-dependent enzyme [Candidatus Roizmanbacteria bacterium]|nr:aminotransferase class III-fold pyridoxal phosphate-dependent enzyme [Candidatus Roizmanbacteria bacterium]
MIFAKGMGNGAVIAATVTTNAIGEKSYTKSNPQSTFGWTPLNVAAAMKTLEIHKRDKIWMKAKKDGEYLLKTLQEELKNSNKVNDISGMGMEIGVHLNTALQHKTKMRDFISKARNNGLHLAYADETNFQLMPPLTIERKDLDRGIEIFIDLLK